MDNIAIIGMGCLYPGYVTKKDFWEKLIEGKDFMAEDNFLNRKIERASMPRERAEEFFKSVFSPEEYEELSLYGDLFKWTMYIVKDALLESGYLYDNEKLKHTGMIMGAFGMPAIEHINAFEDLIKCTVEVGIRDFLEKQDFEFEYKKDQLKPQALLTDTEPQRFVAEKISLGGPVVTLNAACSSPVYAIKEAMMYLESGKADMMLAGAQCYNQMDFAISGMFDLLGILSQPGENKPFDKNSQGVIAGSGAGIFVLKRLKDAIRDKDNILGVIESIGWSNDGSSKFILAPDSKGQVRSYEDAYKDGLSPDIDYIECHATGTAAGDVVEIDSISKFFRQKGYDPILGALKGNTGHFFTASSHAAIAKVLMAMQHGIIPQTIRIVNPIDNRIILQNTKWEKKGDVKRAAVNSFGFGGTNAHIVIREYDEKRELANLDSIKEVQYENKKADMAIVGLGMHIGEMNSVNEYYKHLLQSKPIITKARKERWHDIQQNPKWLQGLNLEIPKGAYIYNYDFDFLEFKFPATGDDFFLRKDFLLLNVAKEALKDANIAPGSHPNTAVIINCSLDYSEINFMSTTELGDGIIKSFKNSFPDLSEGQIQELISALQETESIRQTATAVPGMMPNVRASRICAKWGFEGPCFVTMERENGIGRALEVAKYLMDKENIENVVIGTIELTGEVEHIYAQNLLKKGDILTEYGMSEGVVVIVLKKLEAAIRDKNTIYSVVDEISMVNADPSHQNVKQKMKDSLDIIMRDDVVSKREIGYVEIPTIALLKEKEAVKDLIYNEYKDYLSSSDFIEGSVENMTGYSFSLTAGIAMVKNALQIYHGIKFDEKNGKHVTWSNEGEKRASLINSFNDDGASAHFILSSFDCEKEALKKMNSRNILYPIVVNGEESLREKLNNLSNIGIKQGMKTLYDEIWNEYTTSSNKDKVLCLVARDKEALKGEAKAALEQIHNFFKKGFKWESINGSYFTSNPMGKDAKIVYMYPPGGMFNSAKFFEYLSRFPEFKKKYESFINAHFMTQSGIKGKPLEDYIMELVSAEIISSIANEKLGLKSTMVIGASMGEIAPLFALNSVNFEEGSTYNSIIGEMVDVLAFMFDENPVGSLYEGKKIDSFESWYVKGKKDELEKIVEDEKTVFLTIVGSKDDVVITGDGEACRRVLDKFSGFGTSIKTATIIHSPIAGTVYEESGADRFAKKIEFKSSLPYEIYSSFTLRPVEFGKDHFQDLFRYIITKTVNFNGSVEKAYDDGGDIFIDMSTNEICSTWALNTLKNKDRDTLVLSLYSQKCSPEENYIRVLAKLISNDVNFDLDRYLDMFDFDISNKQRLEKKLNLGLMSFTHSLQSDKYKGFKDQLLEKYGSTQEEADKNNIEEAKIVKDPIIEEPLVKETIIEETIVEKPAPLDKKPIAEKIEIKAPIAIKREDILRKPFSTKDYMGKYINKAIVGNMNAYSLYLQNEQVILKSLVKTMANSPKIVTKLTEDADKKETEDIKQNDILVIDEEKKEIPKDKKNCLWDLDEIVEMSAHSMAKVLGPRYEQVDKHAIRARLPLPPFLFVSRITKIEAEYGVFKPAMIEIEYDVTDDCMLVVGDQISHIVVTESAQIGIFLVAYMGIDEISNGTLHFRIADTKAIIHSDLPKIGETFRGVYEIKSFFKQGATTLVVNTYKCYVGDRLVLSLDGIGGFFTDQDLENSKGIIETPKIAKNKNQVEEVRVPIAFRPHKDSYGIDELTMFYNGLLEGNVHGSMESRKPIPEIARMLDRITYLSDVGGRYGLGEMIAEKDIDDTHWAFKVHFVNDPVLPVSLILEGVNQMAYFLLDSNVFGKTTDHPVSPDIGRYTKGLFRGQVRPIKSTITYKISFKQFIDTKEKFVFFYDADVYWEGTHIVKVEDLSISLRDPKTT